MFGVQRFQLQRARGFALQLFGQHFAFFRFHHHPVAPAYGAGWGNDDDVAVAIKRLHGIAGNLQRIGVLVHHIGKRDLLPAAADGKPRVVEKAAAASLRQSDQRNPLRPLRAAAHQSHKFVQPGAGGLQNFGD